MAVANGTEKFRCLMIVFLPEIQDPKPVHVMREKRRIFHVRVINCALLAEETNHLYRIALLPEEMAQITVGPYLLTNGLAQAQQGTRVVDHKIRVHLERDAMDSMLAGKLRRLLPIRNNPLRPLPLERLAMLRRPVIHYPVRYRIRRRTSRTTGETHHGWNVQHAGQL